MSTHVDKKEVADLLLTGGSTIAKFLSITEPNAAALGAIADCIIQRRSKKRLKRLERLIHSHERLERRVQRLENKSQDEIDIDLLTEIIAQAISDEDEDKTEFYAAFIEYYMSNPLEPYQIRLLNDALKGLTIYEIRYFVNFSKSQLDRDVLPEDLKEGFWNRIDSLGLHNGGAVRHADRASLLGKKLIEICDLAISES